MEILGDFARRCDWADFHVVGGWPEGVALWKDRLKDEPNIVFHGHVAPSEVPRYLRAMDVLIAPYQPVVDSARRRGSIRSGCAAQTVRLHGGREADHMLRSPCHSRDGGA